MRQQPYPVLLDSGHPGSPWGRFDIMVADPFERVEYQHGSCFLYSDESVTPSALDPIKLLQQRLAQYPACASDDDTPFCGGAVGYFGYDLGRAFEQLPEQASTDLSLPDMQVGLYGWAIIVDHRQQRSCLVSNLLSLQELEQIAAELTLPATEANAFTLTSAFQSNLKQQDYARQFDRIKDYIQAGDCYQVNLAQRFSAGYQGDPWQAYCHLRQHAPTPFSAYMERPDAAILSLSPERFIAVKDGAVETRPIKGTRPRSPDKNADLALKQALQRSPKDRAENLMIVDLLRNDLGRICLTGSVKVPELFKVESYANVHHLVSTITGRLKAPLDSLPLLASSFPGGSITGAPKIRAMEIIEELEPHRRGPYCGSIGYIGFDGRMDTSICIRTLVANQGQIHCWAGGGIVADSDCDAEYQETFDKVSNLLGPLETRFLNP
nr:aminodeoxychorismate synthase component I [Motiliproteus sediminis]